MRYSCLFLLFLVFGCVGSDPCPEPEPCEEILVDTVRVDIVDGLGDVVDRIGVETRRNGDFQVVRYELEPCPPILVDTVWVLVEDDDGGLLGRDVFYLRKNGDFVNHRVVCPVLRDTLYLTERVPVVDSRYLLGVGRHSAVDLKLVNYFMDDSNDSDFGENAELFEGQTRGQVEFWFSGSAGHYEFVARVENDAGVSNDYALFVNGDAVKVWSLAGKSRDEQVEISVGVDLVVGSWVELRSSVMKPENAGEIDWIELSEL